MGCFFSLVELAIAVLVIAGMWKVFEKAGKPGWAAIIPIYNAIILAEIVGKPTWWFIIFLIPFVNIVGWIEVAKLFGKSDGYGVGLALLGVVFIPMLGFSDAQFTGKTGSPPPVPPAQP